MKFETPIMFLDRLKKKEIIVKLKWKTVFKGKLESFDEFMNLVMTDVINITDSNLFMGHMLIRCNNIKFIEEVFKIN